MKLLIDVVRPVRYVQSIRHGMDAMQFTRTLATDTERYAKAMFGVNARKAASVTCSSIAGRKSYTVEILNVDGVSRFVWIDRAEDAYEARHKAWRAFMRKQRGECR